MYDEVTPFWDNGHSSEDKLPAIGFVLKQSMINDIIENDIPMMHNLPPSLFGTESDIILVKKNNKPISEIISNLFELGPENAEVICSGEDKSLEEINIKTHIMILATPTNDGSTTIVIALTDPDCILLREIGLDFTFDKKLIGIPFKFIFLPVENNIDPKIIINFHNDNGGNKIPTC